MSKKEEREGTIHPTKQGCLLKIITYHNSQNCDVQFLDEYGYTVQNREYKEIIKGTIKNPYHPSVYGVGYGGEGRHRITIDNRRIKMSRKWSGALERSYCPKYHKRFPTYIGCSIDKHWANFQNFGDWFEANYKPEYMEGWCLDKDILFKGNKIYSPETCCFVPSEINNLLTNRKNHRGEYPLGVRPSKNGKKFVAYCCKEGKWTHIKSCNTIEEAFEAHKIAKEGEIKRLANKWRGQITEPWYQALMNWTVNITD